MGKEEKGEKARFGSLRFRLSLMEGPVRSVGVRGCAWCVDAERVAWARWAWGAATWSALGGGRGGVGLRRSAQEEGQGREHPVWVLTGRAGKCPLCGLCLPATDQGLGGPVS